MSAARDDPVMRSGRREIEGIQILRAFAALSVTFLHIEGVAGALVGHQGVSPWPWLDGLPWEAGVDVFFVISGFVMVYASAGLFGARGAMRAFLARRIARIVPLYWLVTTLILLVGLASPGLLNDAFAGGVRGVIASYLFIPWPRADGTMEPVMRLGWTLNYEMAFYLLFAVFLPLPRRHAVPSVTAAILFLVAAGRFCKPVNAQLAFWTDPVIAEFTFGVALGSLRLAEVRLTPIAGVLLGAAGVAMLLAIEPDALSRSLRLGIPAACIVGAGALGRGGPPPLLGRGLVLLGDASYALYLLHLFPLRALRELWVRLALVGPAGLIAYVIASLAASCGLAVLVHLTIERPLVRAARRAFGV